MRFASSSSLKIALATVVLLAVAGVVMAANCKITSVNRVPLNDLGAGLYLGQFQGGLYPGGTNTVPAVHATAGAIEAQGIVPRSPQGVPAPQGRYVLLSVGMSNTTQEFSRFMQIAASHPQVDHSHLAIVDGAAGGQTASTWDQPTDVNYDRVRDQELIPFGLSELQVQAVWLKVANAGPTIALPNANADARTLVMQQGNVVRALRVRYPNLRVVFLSSRIYAGYASTTLNPEPYAYESAFGVKWLIEAQINQANGAGIDPSAGDLGYGPGGIAPWLVWGPYLWADGTTPRSDGLTWACSDLSNDGTHPSDPGRLKVANMLLEHLLASPFSQPWFAGRQGDLNDDGVVDVADLLAVIGSWGPCPQPCPARCPADIAPLAPNGVGTCVVNVSDLLMVIGNWG